MSLSKDNGQHSSGGLAKENSPQQSMPNSLVKRKQHMDEVMQEGLRSLSAVAANANKGRKR